MVLVVDDEQEVRESLCRMFRLSGFACFTASSARTGLLLLKENPEIQVVILDMRMGDKALPEGYEYPGMYFLDKYRDINPKARVIVLTAYPVMETAVPALSGGVAAPAVAYLEKGVGNNELLARVRSLLREVTVDEFHVDMAEEKATCNGIPIDLTNREFKLLAFFMMTPERPIPYEDIAKAIDGETLSRAEAVKKWRSHVSRLRGKLEALVGREVILSPSPQNSQGNKFLRKKGGDSKK